MPHRLRRLLRIVAILAGVDGVWELGMSWLGARVSWWDYLVCWVLVAGFTAVGYRAGRREAQPTRRPNPGATIRPGDPPT